MKQGNDRAVILFDGVCNLCNGAVQFIIQRDIHAHFVFASLQSHYAAEVMRHHGYDPAKLHSILVLENGVLFERSDAILHIVSHLRGWSWLRHLKFIPRFFRDAIYNLIATSRYSIFGKRESCMIPTPDLKERFIDF